MWPWEHVAVGYLLLSLWRRSGRKRPREREALLVAFGAVVPDLVDKPLGWSTSLLPSGVSLAHSVFVAVPVTVAVVLAARRAGRAGDGTAFGVGYLSHLPADAVYPALVGGDPKFTALLWPLVSQGSGTPEPFFRTLVETAGSFQAFLATPAAGLYVAFELLLLGGALAAWYADGVPGVRTAGRIVRRLVPAVAG